MWFRFRKHDIETVVGPGGLVLNHRVPKGFGSKKLIHFKDNMDAFSSFAAWDKWERRMLLQEEMVDFIDALLRQIPAGARVQKKEKDNVD